jgi:hypothetical protein
MTVSTLHAQPALFDIAPQPEIESDGLTLDTPHGSVDLVAVERALSGEHIHLTYAEHRYVAALVRTHLARYPSDRYTPKR